MVKVEIIHIGEDYYTIGVNGKEVDVNYLAGTLIEKTLKGIIKSLTQ